MQRTCTHLAAIGVAGRLKCVQQSEPVPWAWQLASVRSPLTRIGV